MKTANVIIHSPLAITFLLIAAGVSADAETILTDWGGSGTGGVTAVSNPASDGKRWNSLGANNANPTNAALIDSTGGSTPVTVTVSTGNGSGSGWGDFNGAAGSDPYDEAAVHDDALFNSGTGAIPITFSGLQANTEYDFTTINRRTVGTGQNGKITISAGTSTDIGSGIVLVLNGDVLSFSATSNAAGTISLGFADNTGASGGPAMNGMTISGDLTVSTPAPPQLSGFTYDPVTGNSEVSLKAALNTDYKLVEAGDLDFTTP